MSIGTTPVTVDTREDGVLECRSTSMEPREYELTVTVCEGKENEKRQSIPVTIIEGVRIGPLEPYFGDVCGGDEVTITGTGFDPANLEVTVAPADTPFFSSFEATPTTIIGTVANHICWGDGPFEVTVSKFVAECDRTFDASRSFRYDAQSECACPALVPLLAGTPLAAVVGIGNVDSDSDDANDLVIAHTGERPRVWRGNGTGEFSVDDSCELERAPGLENATDIVVADLTADGRDDVAIAYDGTAVVVHVQTADGKLGPPLRLADPLRRRRRPRRRRAQGPRASALGQRRLAPDPVRR